MARRDDHVGHLFSNMNVTLDTTANSGTQGSPRTHAQTNDIAVTAPSVQTNVKEDGEPTTHARTHTYADTHKHTHTQTHTCTIHRA